MSNPLNGKFNANQDKIRDFFPHYSNFISCIPNVKDINDKKFLIDAQVGAMKVTVNGELVDYKMAEDNYSATMKVLGPGVTITITTSFIPRNNEVSWTSEYKLEGAMVMMLGQTLQNTVETMINQTAECIKNKLS